MKKIKVLWIGYSTDSFNRVPYLLKKGLKMHLLMTEKEKVELSCYTDTTNIKIKVIRNTPKNSLIYSMKALKLLGENIKDKEVVISDFFYFISAALIKLRNNSKTKIVLQILSPPIGNKGFKRVINNLFYKFNLFIAKYYGDLIIVLNEPMKEYINKFIKNIVKILVCPPGVRLTFYNKNLRGRRKEILTKIGFKNKKIILMYHGSVSIDRGFNLLIESFRIVKEKFPQTGLIILGSGNYLNKLKQLIINYDLEKDVYLFGKFNHNELKKFINIVDICVSPQPDHLIHNVNNPYKVLESMATKKPIIATDTPPHREMNKGKALYIVKYDPQDMAIGIENLIKNPELRKKLGERGYKFVKKNYNWDKSNEKMYLEIIRLVKNGK